MALVGLHELLRDACGRRLGFRELPEDAAANFALGLPPLLVEGRRCRDDLGKAAADGDRVSSRWVGAYDGFSRGGSAHPLTIATSTIRWVDCREASIRVVATSDTELVFEVDPNAKCGVAGQIVTLTRLSASGPVVDVKTYRSLEKYRAKEYDLFCVYSNTQVAQLIQAMATFTAQTGLTWDQAIDQQPQDVQNILAASWQ
ncbi:MAG: hypothetical protein ACRELZ_14110 [Candidatus Rokuibacteriota bacterium]